MAIHTKEAPHFDVRDEFERDEVLRRLERGQIAPGQVAALLKAALQEINDTNRCFSELEEELEAVQEECEPVLDEHKEMADAITKILAEAKTLDQARKEVAELVKDL